MGRKCAIFVAGWARVRSIERDGVIVGVWIGVVSLGTRSSVVSPDCKGERGVGRALMVTGSCVFPVDGGPEDKIEDRDAFID